MSLFRNLLVTTLASAALFGCGGSDSSANKLTHTPWRKASGSYTRVMLCSPAGTITPCTT